MQNDNWDTCDSDWAAEFLWAWKGRVSNTSTDRQKSCSDRLRRYNGMGQVRGAKPYINITRQQTSTIVAHLGAVQSPKVQVVTSDADWQTRRKARKLDQFFEGFASSQQGAFPSLHDVRTACLRDAVLFDGFGVAQVRVDSDAEGVSVERVPPWEILWDGMDARYGDPCKLARVYSMSRKVLKQWYPDKKTEIDRAPAYTNRSALEIDPGFQGSQTNSYEDYVEVVEGYSVMLGDEPGRHVVTVGGEDIVTEDYEQTELPFIFLRGEFPIAGNVAPSVISDAATHEDAINKLLDRTFSTIDRTALGVVIYKQGQCTQEQLDQMMDAGTLEYSGQTPPEIWKPEPISAGHMQLFGLLQQNAAEAAGISQMAQTGEAQPGLDSGKAIREATLVQSKRMAWLWRQVEQWMVQCARVVFAQMNEAYKRDGADFLVDFDGAGFLKQIKWSDVCLDTDKYTVSVYATSELHGTPADRTQSIEDLFARGLISQGAYAAAQQTPLDADRARGGAARQQELLDKMVDTWLDAEDWQLETLKLDRAGKKPLVQPPSKWIDLPSAMGQVATSFMEAELDGAPEELLGVFTQWLDTASSMLDEQMAKMQAAQQPPPAAPQETTALPAQ